MQGQPGKAIEECRRAVAADPAQGDPYHDIGVYLIELGRAAEAIEWLERAASSQRCRSRHCAWFHLGRACIQLEMYGKARACLLEALEIEPDYQPAEAALERLRSLVQ